MSAEEVEAGPARGETRGQAPQGGATTARTCKEDKPHGLKGHPRPDDDGESGESGEVRGGRSGGDLLDASAGDTREFSVEDNDDGEEDNDDGEEDEDCSSEEGTCGDKTRVTRSDCSSESCIPTPSCRICFQGAEQGELLNLCRCDGSVRYTHQPCLLKWISERGCWTCELCCYRFHVLAVNMKRPWQWQAITITLVEKVQIIAVFLGSLFLVASISWLLWSALSPQAVWQRRDVLFQICYGMYGFMDLVCIGLIVHEGAAVHNVFMRWRAVNLHWDVQSYDKAADMEEIPTGPPHTSLVSRTLWLPLSTLGPDGPLHQTQLGPQGPWTCLCLHALCPALAPREGLGQDPESGEVVVCVTSV